MPGGRRASGQQKLDQLLPIHKREVTKQRDASVFSLSCMPSDGESWSYSSRELLRRNSTQANRTQIVDQLNSNTIHHKRLEKQMLLLCPSTYNLQKRNIINWKNKGRVLHSEIKELTSFLMQQDSALVKRSFLSPEVVKSCPCFHAALLSSSA